jgi:hypothetical protein
MPETPASSGRSPSPHHAEAFCEGIPNRWGWQCLTCDAEAYTATLALAEAGVERHERETTPASTPSAKESSS